MGWQTVGAYLHRKRETYEARRGLADHHHRSPAQMPASDIEKKEQVVSLASDIKQNNTPQMACPDYHRVYVFGRYLSPGNVLTLMIVSTAAARRAVQ